jgi:hypothetical protein
MYGQSMSYYIKSYTFLFRIVPYDPHFAPATLSSSPKHGVQGTQQTRGHLSLTETAKRMEHTKMIQLGEQSKSITLLYYNCQVHIHHIYAEITAT